jgi:hypothetical protein
MVAFVGLSGTKNRDRLFRRPPPDREKNRCAYANEKHSGYSNGHNAGLQTLVGSHCQPPFFFRFLPAGSVSFITFQSLALTVLLPIALFGLQNHV